MNAIILCGGLSTRLGDITKDIPKVLLPVGDRTVLDWQLAKLKRLGIGEVVLAAGHLADVIAHDVGPERNGTQLVYAVEHDQLGTGGAIKNAMAHAPDPQDATIILNGDILTTANLAHMIGMITADSDGVILGSLVPDASSYGTLIYGEDKHLNAFREKEGVAMPGYINGGVYLFTPNACTYFPERSAFSIEYDVFPHMKHLSVYESDAPWVDIGVPERLLWAREHWREFLEDA